MRELVGGSSRVSKYGLASKCASNPGIAPPSSSASDREQTLLAASVYQYLLTLSGLLRR
jgi:hypothetical protein